MTDADRRTVRTLVRSGVALAVVAPPLPSWPRRWRG